MNAEYSMREKAEMSALVRRVEMETGRLTLGDNGTGGVRRSRALWVRVRGLPKGWRSMTRGETGEKEF